MNVPLKTNSACTWPHVIVPYNQSQLKLLEDLCPVSSQLPPEESAPRTPRRWNAQRWWCYRPPWQLFPRGCRLWQTRWSSSWACTCSWWMCLCAVPVCADWHLCRQAASFWLNWTESYGPGSVSLPGVGTTVRHAFLRGYIYVHTFQCNAKWKAMAGSGSSQTGIRDLIYLVICKHLITCP